ncbi:TPA: hypothetical protein ENS27_02515 [bacterium]|mgnify:CR=1 FL=1|nr:hypothetical protein [bacterium]
MIEIKTILIISIICFILYPYIPDIKADNLPFELDRPLYVGSRPISMGNAFISIADSAESGFWNPAGLIQNQGVRIFFAGKIWDRKSDIFDSKCIAYCYRNSAFFWGNKIALRLDNDETPDFNYYSYAHKINSYMAVGLSIKFKRKHPSDYYQFFGYDPAYDLGFLLKADGNDSVGFLIQKLSGEKQWIDIANIGFSHKLYRDLLASTDLAFLLSEKKLEPHIGFEYFIRQWLAIRFGVSNKLPSVGIGFIFGRLIIDSALIRIDDNLSAFLSAQFQL